MKNAVEKNIDHINEDFRLDLIHSFLYNSGLKKCIDSNIKYWNKKINPIKPKNNKNSILINEWNIQTNENESEKISNFLIEKIIFDLLYAGRINENENWKNFQEKIIT